MKRGNNALVDLIVYSSLVAGILVLTKPGSQGPKLVSASTRGYAGIIQAETGQSVTT